MRNAVYELYNSPVFDVVSPDIDWQEKWHVVCNEATGETGYFIVPNLELSEVFVVGENGNLLHDFPVGYVFITEGDSSGIVSDFDVAPFVDLVLERQISLFRVGYLRNRHFRFEL